MALKDGDKVFVADEDLYRTKDGRIVGEDDPDKLTKVAVKGQRMPMARAASVGLVSAGEAGTMTETGREDRITPMTPQAGARADRTDRVRPLTPAGPASSAPADNAKTADASDTKSMPAPEDKAVRRSTKKRKTAKS